MNISIIASGSNGNSCLVEHKDATILIDAGLSCKEIEQRLKSMGRSLDALDAIVLTHSHSDHTRGAGPVARRYQAPVYMLNACHRKCHGTLGDIIPRPYTIGQGFMVHGVIVKPIPTSHSVPSSGFVIGDFGIFTDTGVVTPEMRKAMPKLSAMLLESNHDPDMLRDGPYPAFLKRWILSDTGHLSNHDASAFIEECGKSLERVYLGHLSGNNNTPQKAAETFESLVTNKLEYQVCSRNSPTGSWEI